MGDDEHYSAFDVGEEQLLIGGGGAHEEEEREDEETLGGSRDDQSDSEGGDEEEEDTKAADKLIKKRKKLEDLKVKKRLKVESLKQEQKQPSQSKVHQLSVEAQFELFNQQQPLTAAGGLVAALPLEVFYSPPADALQKGGNPFIRAVELGLGGGSKAKLAKPSDEMGCPQVLILCAGAKRAASIINGISKKVHCKISKLFARHFKVTEQVEMLSKQHYPIAVGTPNRVEKLLELGALCLRNTQLVLVDMEADAKHFTVLSLPGVKEDFFKVMGSWVSKEIAKSSAARPKIMLVAE